MEVVEAVLSPMENRGSYAVIIDNCRLLLEELGRAALQHCAREANGAAHLLAHHDITHGIREFWFDDSPSFLVPVIINDCVIIQYSLRLIILFANIDVSRHILVLDTSVLAKSIMGRRE
jgi:hypothetical protein